MMDFLKNMIVCKEYARIARLELLFLLSDVKCEVLHLQNFNFRIKVDRSTVKYVSCSIPPDINRNIIISQKPVFETAIMDDEDGLIYDETLGYEDVRRFETIYKVADEIKRICSIV